MVAIVILLPLSLVILFIGITGSPIQHLLHTSTLNQSQLASPATNSALVLFKNYSILRVVNVFRFLFFGPFGLCDWNRGPKGVLARKGPPTWHLGTRHLGVRHPVHFPFGPVPSSSSPCPPSVHSEKDSHGGRGRPGALVRRKACCPS